MEVKLIEIRDSATFIPAMAIALIERSEAERFLLRRAGYSAEQIAPLDGQGVAYERYIILVKLDGVEAQYDPFGWASHARTMPTAHRWIIEHWNDLVSGDVVDVEFILGEKPEPKVSERATTGALYR